MKILYAASEANPFAKSGGLADVAGALPKALVRDGVDARVIMPLYGDLKFRDSWNTSPTTPCLWAGAASTAACSRPMWTA